MRDIQSVVFGFTHSCALVRVLVRWRNGRMVAKIEGGAFHHCKMKQLQRKKVEVEAIDRRLG